MAGYLSTGTDLSGEERLMKFVIIYGSTGKESTYNCVRISLDKMNRRD